jgi:hypothetical protein
LPVVGVKVDLGALALNVEVMREFAVRFLTTSSSFEKITENSFGVDTCYEIELKMTERVK